MISNLCEILSAQQTWSGLPMTGLVRLTSALFSRRIRTIAVSPRKIPEICHHKQLMQDHLYETHSNQVATSDRVLEPVGIDRPWHLASAAKSRGSCCLTRSRNAKPFWSHFVHQSLHSRQLRISTKEELRPSQSKTWRNASKASFLSDRVSRCWRRSSEEAPKIRCRLPNWFQRRKSTFCWDQHHVQAKVLRHPKKIEFL